MSADVYLRTRAGDLVTLSMHGYGVVDLFARHADATDFSFARLDLEDAKKLAHALVAFAEDRIDETGLEAD